MERATDQPEQVLHQPVPEPAVRSFRKIVIRIAAGVSEQRPSTEQPKRAIDGHGRWDLPAGFHPVPSRLSFQRPSLAFTLAFRYETPCKWAFLTPPFCCVPLEPDLPKAAFGP